MYCQIELQIFFKFAALFITEATKNHFLCFFLAQLGFGNLLNYAFGLTKVSLRDYFFASWIGMMPGTVMYVYIGSLAGDLAALGAGGRTRSPQEWALYLVGLLATVVVTIYITKIAKKALGQKVGSA